MSLTQEQIEKLWKNLSKLSAQNDEKLVSDINWIIWYIDILNEVDTTWVKPTVSVINGKNTLKKDVISKKKATPNDLLECSNQKVIWNQITLSNIMQ